jgi:hypothetical protein
MEINAGQKGFRRSSRKRMERAIAVSRIPPWLASGWGMSGRLRHAWAVIPGWYGSSIPCDGESHSL